jgi:hypothetical protein
LEKRELCGILSGDEMGYALENRGLVIKSTQCLSMRHDAQQDSRPLMFSDLSLEKACLG